jgi:hypothetical protein
MRIWDRAAQVDPSAHWTDPNPNVVDGLRWKDEVMDQDRFDLLARRVAQPRSRRGVARILIGGALGAGGLAAFGRGADAKKHHHHHHHHGGGGGGGGGGDCSPLGADCGFNGDCCSGRCSTEVVSTCRRLDCVETGDCAVDTDCCGGFCLGGCCQGVC